MREPGERASTVDTTFGGMQTYLGNSVYQAPEVEISGTRSWAP
jgi:hypothetical protein